MIYKSHNDFFSTHTHNNNNNNNTYFTFQQLVSITMNQHAVHITINIHVLFLFSNLRKKRPPKILMHLCAALICLLVTLLAGFGAKRQHECQTFSVATHYFVLASFFWMAVEGVNMYFCTVKITGKSISMFLRKACVFAWGKSLYIEPFISFT